MRAVSRYRNEPAGVSELLPSLQPPVEEPLMNARRSFNPLLLILAPQVIGCIAYPYRVSVDFRESVPAAGVRKVVVDTSNGAIEVACTAGKNEIDVHAEKCARGLTPDDARKWAEEIRIAVAPDPADPATLHVRADLPVSMDGRSQSASFRVAMPPSADLVLETSNGPVTVAGSEGEVRARTSNGRIEARDLGGAISGRTTNGSITARNVRGDVDLHTSNGRIDMEQVGKDSVNATTSNGRIRVVDASGSASIRSSNGSVEVRFRALPARPDIRVSTSNGSVTVEVPNSVNADLAMDTSVGRVRADLQAVQVADFESDRDRLRARLNDGGGAIDIRSSVGSVTFRTVAERGSRPGSGGGS
jgi:hypothetical protein